ncbi:MAG: HAMP domain-containing histidine kinase [Christensenellaceae bacterium]|nr:HAMP domain-containing histidine kinase [Christensenellaceae bacterium]
MKLWLKQTLLAMLIILLSASACLYFFVALQTSRLLSDARESGLRDASSFCEHLATLNTTSGVNVSADVTTRRALVQYTFSTFAHLLQDSDNAYALVIDGESLYSISHIDTLALMPITPEDVSASMIFEQDGRQLLLSARNITVLELPVTVYALQDIGGVFAQIGSLTRMAQAALLICLLVSGAVLPVMIRGTLKPLRQLGAVSEKIAGGQYALRSGIKTCDEVGELSRAFDHMAETVEQKILDLEDTAQRRELLLGALTHEMKTPMTAIIGFSDSLLTMPLSEEARMEAAHEIHEAALRTERLSQKMMQLIAMTDCPVLVWQTIDAAHLAETVEKATRPLLESRGVALSVRLEGQTLRGDADLLTSLLTNLIDNAAKASPAGSTIALTVAPCRLTVADEGSGIPAEQIPLVTEPFYRVDKARSRKLGGAGLGLSLCRMIAQAHGGELNIRSELGRGTAITMTWRDRDE